MINKALHKSTEIVSIINLQSCATLFQALCLLETLVVRTKENRNIPYSSLQGIMNTYAKTTTDISHISIAIDTAKQSEAIDDEDI